MNQHQTHTRGQTNIRTRSLVFHGTREDALERLPSLDRSERLELSAHGISLITEQRRVDLRFRAEAHYRDSHSIKAFMALEFSFLGESDRDIDLFIYRFRAGNEPMLH